MVPCFTLRKLSEILFVCSYEINIVSGIIGMEVREWNKKLMKQKSKTKRLPKI